MVIRRKKPGVNEDRVFIGKIFKPHGLKGEIKFHSFGCPMDVLESFNCFYRDSNGSELQLESIRGMEGAVILKFQSVQSRDEAEQLQGEVLWVHEHDLPDLEEDYIYASDLLYALAETDDGVPLGKVEDIIETGSTDVIVIRGKGEEHLLPVHRDWIQHIDKESKRIIVKLLDYEDSAHETAKHPQPKKRRK